MDKKFGIDIIWQNENGKIYIEYNKLELCFTDIKKEIYLEDIHNLQSRDNENNFYLRIVGKEDYILSFKSLQIRDFFKAFIYFAMKKYKNISDSQENLKLNLSTTQNSSSGGNNPNNTTDSGPVIPSHMDIDNLENTKSSLVEYLSYNPVLLVIYEEMNCNLNQFYNYLKSSYFYCIKNEKNVIDRLLNEKLREHSIKECDFATRLNNFSYMNLTRSDVQNYEEKKSVVKEVEFHPQYITKKVNFREKVNDFAFPKSLELKYDPLLSFKKENILKEYDKNVLKKLLGYCRMAYQAKIEGRDVSEDVLKIMEEFKDVLADPNLESFRPSRFL